MAVNYSTALKQTRMQMVTDYIDTKTINASTGAGVAGKLVIGTSALSGATGVLVTFTCQLPAFDSVTGGVANLDISPAMSVNASATGTAALAEFRTSANVVVASGLTVGTSGADIILNTLSIVSGNPVSISSGTITHS